MRPGIQLAPGSSLAPQKPGRENPRRDGIASTPSSICRTPPASRAMALRSGRSRVCHPVCADGSRVGARRARRRSSGTARRSPTLRPSSVRGSQSTSSLPRGRLRLTAGRSVESPDVKKQRNESPARSYNSFRNLPWIPLILCFPIAPADRRITPVATAVLQRQSRSGRAAAGISLSTGPRYDAPFDRSKGWEFD